MDTGLVEKGACQQLLPEAVKLSCEVDDAPKYYNDVGIKELKLELKESVCDASKSQKDQIELTVPSRNCIKANSDFLNKVIMHLNTVVG